MALSKRMCGFNISLDEVTFNSMARRKTLLQAF